MSTNRRGVGEGAIYKRKDGRWAASVSLGYGPRKQEAKAGIEQPQAQTRKRTVVYGTTRKEVEHKLQEMRRTVDSGLPVIDQRTTLSQYLEGWIERVTPRLRPLTALRYRSIIKLQLSPQLGSIKLAKLSPSDIAAMFATLHKDGLSPRTVHHCRAVLRTALTDAEKWGLVSRNVAKLTDAVKVDTPTPKLPDIENVHKIVDAVRGTDVENEVVLALYSGMRIGEVTGLRWSDVSFDNGQIIVSHSLQHFKGKDDAKGKTSLVEPKSKTSKRTLQLSAPAMDALRNEQSRQLERGGRWKAQIPDLVFTEADGSPMLPTTVLRKFQRALKAAGLPVMRFHDLRHYHGALMLSAGVDIGVVSKLLGHSSVALTLSTYVGIMPALKQDAADRFERLLRQPG